ncbi:tyrosine-type recombinase/integrase [Mesorhizobium sp. Cs1299R1N1]|uniref:tyrosine-type recombinase/integrase n=1 Tax=Mesorhizobium sp. Cs1299R1N1 TaxID=3015172 RepID=UPI00301CA37C
MATKIDTLNRELRNRIKAGKPNLWSHGNGLCFALAKNGTASWVIRYTVNAKRRVMTLEPHSDPISDRKLKELEMVALEYRDKVKAGIDPLAMREATANRSKSASGDTFETFARDYIAQHESDWKNEKHRQQWDNTLSQYVYPKIGRALPHEISVDDVLSVLQQPHIRRGKKLPLWDAVPETASRVRMRIETIIAAAKSKALGSANPETKALWKDHHNPAKWEDGLQHWLGKKGKQFKGNFAAMAFADVPAFVQELQTKADYSAKALMLTILCATRTSETLNAVWTEFDLEAATWTIPAARMKAGVEHRVPLSSAAITLLKGLHRIADHPYAFPGAKRNQPLSNMAMLESLRGMRDGLTVHGFRSAFRDWCSETTLHPDTIAEMALAHTIKDRTVAAYRRGDAFDRRKQLMQQWCDYLLVSNDNYKQEWQRLIA